MKRTSILLGVLAVLGAFALPAPGEKAELDLLLGGSESGDDAGAKEPEAVETQVENRRETAGKRAVAEARPSRVIEEIIVTAQKKEQTLQEVPISLSVVDEGFIRDTSITDFRDLSLYVPNVSVNNTGGQYNDTRIRGFGSPFANQKGFEQPVGLVIDGVPYGRRPYWEAALFDVERVEVLRGPQGTLFGKNTTAGLFNVVSKRPTHELTGYAHAELGELDRRRFEGAIGGPLVTNVANFRISALSDERDGFMRNTTARVRAGASERMNSRDRKGVRAQLGLPDVFGVKVIVGYESLRSETNGTGWEFRQVVPNQVPFFLTYDPNTDFEPDNWIGSTEQRDFTRADIDTFVANASYDLGGWGLDLVAGRSVLDFALHLDEDFTPAPYFKLAEADENPQIVFELRATSPNLPGLLGMDGLFGWRLGRSDFVAGFFFDDRKIENGAAAAELNAAILGQLLVTDATGVVPPCPDCESQAEEATIFYEQESRSFAGFGQMDWHLADRWTLEYGMRFSHESKEGDWLSECTVGTCATFIAALNAEEFTARRSRSESAFTPKVTLSYDWTSGVNFYAGWGRGFKAGGFNGTIFNDNNPETIAVDPEETTSWEVGAKSDLFEGTGMVNVALFRQEVTNLQVFTVTPDANIEIRNAGEARSQGVEADATWLPSSWLTLRGSLGFNDTEYLEFPFGTCSFDRPDTDGDGDPRCDHSGRPFEFAPEWKGTVTGIAQFPLSGFLVHRAVSALSVPGLHLTGGLNIEYSDNYYATASLDPRTRQSSFIRLNGNVGLANPNQGWSLGLVAENLTDEPVAVHIRDISLVGKSFIQTLDPPRLLFGRFRWEF